jgi:hypothetical protein
MTETRVGLGDTVQLTHASGTIVQGIILKITKQVNPYGYGKGDLAVTETLLQLEGLANEFNLTVWEPTAGRKAE